MCQRLLPLRMSHTPHHSSNHQGRPAPAGSHVLFGKRNPLLGLLLLLVVALPIVSSFAGCGLLSGGSGAARRETPYEPLPNALDEEYLHSPFGDVAAHYPAGWLHVDLQSVPLDNVQEVYTDPQRRRALVLAELPATAEARRSVERDGMRALAERSFQAKLAKRSRGLVLTRPVELYTVHEKLFASYEYAEVAFDTLERREHRIVLFTTGAKWYELGMIELQAPITGREEHLLNFRLLESVVGSLEGAARIQTGEGSAF